MLVIAQFLPAFYFYAPWMCLGLALAPAIGVSVPRHKWNMGRILVATFTSALAGAVCGFVATYVTGKLCVPSAGGNNAQAGILVFLVMVIVSPLTAYLVAGFFPAAKTEISKENTANE